MGGCGSREVAEPLLVGGTKLGEGARLEEEYRVQGGALGFGRVATVREGRHKRSAKEVAIKACSKAVLGGRPERISRTSEVEALQHLWEKETSCPHIIQLYGTYEDNHYLYLVLELARGGDLFQNMAGRATFSEEDAACIGQQLLEAVDYCHRKGVVHRDLKPENILLSEPDGLDIKVVDFGSAAIVGEKTRLHDFMATPFYAAPEVWGRPPDYGREVDTWSVGAILYVLLTGLPPVLTSQSVKNNPTWQSLQAGKVEGLPPSTSLALVDLLKKLLDPDPRSRITPAQALNHPWITGVAPRGKVNLEGSIRGIQAYTRIRQFQKAAVVLLSVLLDAKELRTIGRKMREVSKTGGTLRETELEALLVHLGMSSQADSLRRLRQNMLYGGAEEAKIGELGFPVEFDVEVFLEILKGRRMAMKHLNRGRKLEESTKGSNQGMGLDAVAPYLAPRGISASTRVFKYSENHNSPRSKSTRMPRASSAGNLKLFNEEAKTPTESGRYDDSNRFGTSFRLGSSMRYGASGRYEASGRFEEVNIPESPTGGERSAVNLGSVKEGAEEHGQSKYGASSVHGDMLYRSYVESDKP